MRRRALLSLLAALAGGGCLADGRRAGSTPGTATPTPDDCPSFGDADRTVCSADDGPVTLVAESDVFTVGTGDSAVETFRLTVTNHALTAFRFNPYAWGLARRTDDGWHRLPREGYPEPLLELPTGESHVWSLSCQSHPSPGGGPMEITADLRDGTYAFHVDGRADDGRRVECVARFRVAVE